jgi:hypothetical protein
MYRGLMFLIGILYLGAFLGALLKTEWLWATVFVCFGISNIALCLIAAKG